MSQTLDVIGPRRPPQTYRVKKHFVEEVRLTSRVDGQRVELGKRKKGTLGAGSAIKKSLFYSQSRGETNPTEGPDQDGGEHWSDQ